MSDLRAGTLGLLQHLWTVPDAELDDAIAAAFAEDVVLDVSHPINRLTSREAIGDQLIRPLRTALAHVRRRDEIFIGGRNRRAEHGDWVAAVTHYVGNFQAPLVGIEPSDHLVFLRSGEFYRLVDGKIVEGKLLIDFLDLMRQAGCFPLPHMLGTEMLFPGPATHDGVLPSGPERSETSLDVVEGMLGDLHVFDPASFGSRDQTGDTGYWHEDMLWYGPGGIGSNYRWEGFVKDHRESFLSAFPDRKGGNHYCRVGDGNFAAVSGWPSMTMTLQGDYLGVAKTGQALTLRVMDFYRVANGKIMENWVLLDYLELFNQMGIDLIAKARTISGR